MTSLPNPKCSDYVEVTTGTWPQNAGCFTSASTPRYQEQQQQSLNYVSKECSYLGCFKVQKYVTAFCFCLLNIQERLVSTKYGNGFKASQNKQSQCGAKSGVVDTDFFAPTHPPVGKKKSPVNFKQLTIRTALVQDIHLMIKKCVCTVKDF